MSFELPKLPYELDSLEPYMSRETLEFHYGKHHRAYVDNLNQLVSGSDKQNLSLEALIKTTNGPIFNNAAQVWNHTFFWNCLTPKGVGEPKAGRLSQAIQTEFGSIENFFKQFTDASLKHFGSGWSWLVQKADGRLAITTTVNADNPLREGHTPLLTCDVWEHAYYIDYRNRRADFLRAFWKVVDWQTVEKNFRG